MMSWGPLDDWSDEDAEVPDSEDEYIAGQAENQGPPEVSEAKLNELDAEAALAEIQKLHDMQVIEAVGFSDDEASSLENVVDATLVYDWRFRLGKWIRRCRIVAPEYRDGAATTEQNFAPTSSFSTVRVLLSIGLDLWT